MIRACCTHRQHQADRDTDTDSHTLTLTLTLTKPAGELDLNGAHVKLRCRSPVQNISLISAVTSFTASERHSRTELSLFHRHNGTCAWSVSGRRGEIEALRVLAFHGNKQGATI